MTSRYYQETADCALTLSMIYLEGKNKKNIDVIVCVTLRGPHTYFLCGVPGDNVVIYSHAISAFR